MMLQRLRELLTLILVAALPFHAFLVTVGTKLILGPGHAPMTMLASWKEVLLLVILCVAIGEYLINRKWKMVNGKYGDVVDVLIVALLILAIIVPSLNFAFGFRYDFVPLVAFLILRRVPWSDRFRLRAESALLWIGAIIAAYGIVTLVLPSTFFTALGYSDAHSLYVPSGPLSAFQQLSASAVRRIQSTMSGPNQLGIWLLIPLSISLSHLVARNGKWKIENRKLFSTYHLPFSMGLLLLIALLLTFSRSA
jgi:hypothetical protein